MQAVLDLSILMILFFQSLGEWLISAMKLFTMLGNEEFYLLVAPILYWCIDAGLGLRMGLVLMLSDGLCSSFKVLAHGPRPYWYSAQVRALSVEASFGAPSAHAQNAAAIWGMLAAWLKGWGAWAIAIAVILLIGLSRMFLGVHFPIDVAAGWLLGALFLWAFLRLEAPVRKRLDPLSPGGKVLAALGASLGLILLGVLGEAQPGSVDGAPGMDRERTRRHGDCRSDQSFGFFRAGIRCGGALWPGLRSNLRRPIRRVRR